jgi:hypothetical protein
MWKFPLPSASEAVTTHAKTHALTLGGLFWFAATIYGRRDSGCKFQIYREDGSFDLAYGHEHPLEQSLGRTQARL